MAKTKTSRLTEIYKAEKSRGGGLTSAIGKATLEKVDPRQFFNQKGLLAAMLPSLFRAYKAPTTTAGTKSTMPTSLQFSTASLENKIDALTAETMEMKTHAKISAKNSLVLPYMARDMNVMRLNIQKLVKVLGAKPTRGSDAFFKTMADRESMYENKFKREFKPAAKITTISPTPVKTDEKRQGILGGIAAGAGAVAGGTIAAAGSVAGGGLSGIGSVIGGIISALGSVTAAIIGLTGTLVSALAPKIADLAKFLLTPASLSVILPLVVAAIAAYGLKKLFDNMKEGEKQKDELSKLREKVKRGETLSSAEQARMKELESMGVTATAGEATRLATKKSMTLGTAQELLSANLSDQEIKDQSGVSRRVLQEYVKQGGKTDTFTLSREMGEEPVGSFQSKDATARMTGDTGSFKGPQGQKLVVQNGVYGYYDTSSGKRVFAPLPQLPLNETSAETSRLARQPVIGTPSTPSTTPTPVSSAAGRGMNRAEGGNYLTWSMLDEKQKDAVLKTQAEHEHGKGKPIKNNNPGNIMYGKFAEQYGGKPSNLTTPHGTVAVFSTLEDGVRAQRALWESNTYKNLPLDKAIGLWAGEGAADKMANPTEYLKGTENYKKSVIAAAGGTYTPGSMIGAPPASEPITIAGLTLPSLSSLPSIDDTKSKFEEISKKIQAALQPSTGQAVTTASETVSQAQKQVAASPPVIIDNSSKPTVVSNPTNNMQRPAIPYDEELIKMFLNVGTILA